MTSTQRILFGAMASLLLVLGFVKAAESFDPVVSHDRLNSASADDIGGSTATRWS